MAKYSTKETVDRQDVLGLNKDEYDLFNKIYKDALRIKMESSSHGRSPGTLDDLVKDVDLKYVILTDGTYRVEFVVEKI